MMLVNHKTSLKMSVNELKKYRHKKRILSLLYHNTPLSAPELSKKIGVSLPTVLLLLNDLMASGLVSTMGTGISTGGRKPSLYGLSDESVFVIACDMGRYVAKLTVFNSHNQRVTPLKYIETHIDDDQLVEKLHDAAKELITGFNIPEEKIVGLGVDMPGLVDSQAGINYTIKNRRLQNVKDRLEKKFGIEVYIDNDARMQAYGEYIFGKAKERRNAIVVNWNWGVGLGMILNGELYGGHTGFAGELSHIQMAEEGDLCICGKRGCLETISSANTLLKLARQGILDGKVSQLTEQFKNRPDEMTPEHIISAARSGDEFSISILNKIGLALGKGLSVIIQLINPEIIVLGGIMAKANQYVLTPIQQALNKFCLEKIVSNTEIVTSDIDEQSGLLGSAAMVYQNLFSDQSIS
ncbi:MAG: ROK family protein [Bacteroidota bacterium]